MESDYRSSRRRRSSFNVSSQLLLLQRLNALVMEMENMTKLWLNCKTQISKGSAEVSSRELEQAFPDEVEAYREIPVSSAAVSSMNLLKLHFLIYNESFGCFFVILLQ
ncbi:hypothetical protein L6452_31705 [Arctium lappa]|uniref:Uncharacterized protein n=1 Tax=Arctium lappa TaxID=4217 RepID=A0ACB8Z2Y0_ARCLA|nr:hypothetical protein L6452_31705 [Arctium lappa]